ncbi:MAG: MFS transporter [bacterium]|nr:MFS transporter [bacterium]
MNKKKLFLWSLYDFANSIIYINFLLYFAQWLVIDGGLSDFWYNAIFAITSVMLLFSAPALAAYTDKHGGRKYFLNISTLGTFLSYSFAVIFAFMGTENIFLVALLFLMGQYFYQLSFVFFNTLLEDVSDAEHRTRASGIGQFSNNFGQVVGLAIVLPLAGSRLLPLIPSLLLFILLALPMMIYFKDSKPRIKKIESDELKNETKTYFKKMIAFFAISVAAPLLVSFFFFSDALLTITNNYPIFMERVFSISDTKKSILLMSILIMSALGALVCGWLGDKFGNKKILKYILLCWIILLPLVGFAPTFKILAVFTSMVGLLIGSIRTVTRSLLTSLLSRDNLAYGFAFYTIAELFATLIGPLTWGGILALWGNEPVVYRWALVSMTVYVVIGLLILQFWRQGKLIKGFQN